MASLGRRVALTVRKKDPQARLCSTHYMYASASHPILQEAEWHGNQARRSDCVCAEMCVPQYPAVVPVVACCEPSGADLRCKES